MCVFIEILAALFIFLEQQHAIVLARKEEKRVSFLPLESVYYSVPAALLLTRAQNNVQKPRWSRFGLNDQLFQKVFLDQVTVPDALHLDTSPIQNDLLQALLACDTARKLTKRSRDNLFQEFSSLPKVKRRRLILLARCESKLLLYSKLLIRNRKYHLGCAELRELILSTPPPRYDV
ncbi:hypothetical protein CEXT_616781 [Caerostris extrusa]|uniref:Uncharacterized protein n=1 Tax=Caerostris extrusa TaxID=172846 RepID=A0AAV4MMR8_CAEEX|nr:hypothetical protein CEXT_616781 [Caerostris extrusa]